MCICAGMDACSINEPVQTPYHSVISGASSTPVVIHLSQEKFPLTEWLFLSTLLAPLQTSDWLSGPIARQRVRHTEKRDTNWGMCSRLNQMLVHGGKKKNKKITCLLLPLHSLLEFILFQNKQAQLFFLLILTHVYHLLHQVARCPSGSFNLAKTRNNQTESFHCILNTRGHVIMVIRGKEPLDAVRCNNTCYILREPFSFLLDNCFL